MVRLQDVLAAQARIQSAIYLSPCARSERLSQLAGCECFLKLENLQMTGSFKERGARNRLLTLDAAQRARGVIAASAGNHAQGLAYHGQQLGVTTTLVMPSGTPLVKLEATRSYGARVVLAGETFDDAYRQAKALQEAEDLEWISPFDDDMIIAGQGTLGLELLSQVPGLDAVVVPVGGGGLAAGLCVALKESAPHVKVYGAEAASVPSLTGALAAGQPVEVASARTLADGIAVRRVGERPFAILQRYLDDVITVREGEIAEAILRLLEQEKTVTEGAGAVALAALLQRHLPVAGQRVVVVVSGGNIDVNIISRVIQRGLMSSGRVARLRVTLPDSPGTLAALLNVIGGHGANVLEVEHDRLAARTDVGFAVVELVIEVSGSEHAARVKAGIEAAGFPLD
jgi:threonine dehydratase